jgi:Zn-dependent peptidase ImmA (M78 family)
MSVKALITPKVLKWARETSKISIEDAAKKMDRPVSTILEWESGNLQPTFKQAEKLAATYKRPLAVFFLPDVPSDFQVLQDFRRKDSAEISTALIFMIREIQQKQKWLKTFLVENDQPKIDFIGKYSIDDSPESVAMYIRSVLEIDSIELGIENPFKEWINRVEANRIFVSISSNFHSRLKISSDDYKGFAISDSYAPFVFINSDEWETVKLFTLVHELAHLFIDKSGISNDINIDFRESNISEYNPVEVFCNKVAANALMTYDIFKSVWENQKPSSQSDLINVAKVFGVSTLSVLYRAHNIGFLNHQTFESWKSVMDKEYSEFNTIYLEKELKKREGKKGGPNYYLLLSKRNGVEFSRVVLDSFRSGSIRGVELSNLLNLKVNKISNYENFIYK